MRHEKELVIRHIVGILIELLQYFRQSISIILCLA
jgi:hypothetical protein